MPGDTSMLSMLRWPLTLGRESQSFIGARWIAALLRSAPKPMQRRLALRVMSWSPHYFFRDSHGRHRNLSFAEFLESEEARNRDTREKIARALVAPMLRPDHVVVDYGCGPGFLAHAVAPHVSTLYGVDVSRGVLECARILNHRPNINYLHSSQAGTVADASADLVYSFAVIQHVSDAVFNEILAHAHRMLKDGGSILFHVVIDAPGWRTESEWRSDTSLAGRAKLTYGLNCFSRDADSVRRTIEGSGFSQICLRPVRDACPKDIDDIDDICRQHLVTAVKATLRRDHA